MKNWIEPAERERGKKLQVSQAGTGRHGSLAVGLRLHSENKLRAASISCQFAACKKVAHFDAGQCVVRLNDKCFTIEGLEQPLHFVIKEQQRYLPDGSLVPGFSDKTAQ